METVLRLQITIFCLLVILILWFSGDRRSTSRMDLDSRLYRALLLSTFAMLFLDTVSWFFDGNAGNISHIAVFIANVFYYIIHTIPIALFIFYSDYQIFREEKRFVKMARPLIIIEVLVSVMAILSPITGGLFSVDKANHYFRGPWFPAFALVQFGLVAFILWHVIHNRRRTSRRIFISLLAYPIPLLIAAVFQMLFLGLVLIWPTMTLFLIVSAFNLEKRRAKTDYLTGTANRRSLDEELEKRIELSKSGKMLFGLLLDIDDFKKINDSFGHEAGDRALEDVANILLSSVRVNDHVARLGGDEFVVLVESSEPMALEDLVHRIENAIENLNATNQRPYQLSLSVGRAKYYEENSAKASDFLAILDAECIQERRASQQVDQKKFASLLKGGIYRLS